MWEVLLDALLDTLKIFPILLLSYIVIEVIENKLSHKMTGKITSKFAPVAGAGLGLIPQCGFSVVATDMFSKKRITMGTLIAIFIATSDEAIPLILAQPDKILTLLPLLLIKFVYGIIIGYVLDFIVKLIKKKESINCNDACDDKEIVQNNEQNIANEGDDEKHHTHDHEHGHDHDEHENESGESEQIKGCCGHDIADENKWKAYLLHPLLHSLKILLYIFIVNVVMGVVIYLAGRENLASFLSNGKWISVICAALVGLIPNCAASVVITELFLTSSLPFGALMAGLITNAGLGIVMLIRQNKNVKENLLLICSLFVSALVLGYALLLLPETWFIF